MKVYVSDTYKTVDLNTLSKVLYNASEWSRRCFDCKAGKNISKYVRILKTFEFRQHSKVGGVINLPETIHKFQKVSPVEREACLRAAQVDRMIGGKE